MVPLQVRRDRLRGIFHVTQVRLAPLIEWRGHADKDRIHVTQPRKLRRRIEPLCLHVLPNLFGRNVLDVALPRVELIDLAFVEVESRHALPYVGKPQRQRQTHVSASYDSHFDVFAAKKLRLALHAHSVSSQLWI